MTNGAVGDLLVKQCPALLDGMFFGRELPFQPHSYLLEGMHCLPLGPEDLHLVAEPQLVGAVRGGIQKQPSCKKAIFMAPV